MFISALQLTHFRNYENSRLTFDPAVNLIWGPNGHGKTNLLEALFYLTIGKSHRKSVDADLIQFDRDYFRLEGQFRTQRHPNVTVEIYYSKQHGKIARVNGQRLDKISELMQILAAVELSPEDTALTKGSPSVRRHFLDFSLSITYASYLHALQEYRQILGQRNELLRQTKAPTPQLMEVWDDQLVAWGSKIIHARLGFVDQLNKLVNELYGTLSPKDKAIQLTYQPFNLAPTAGRDEVQRVYEKRLQQNFRREAQQRVTLIGPHREDVDISFGGLSLRRFGSQGQHRLISTALRLSQALYLKRENDDCPLVLFDDVFAELDERHKELLEDMMPQFEQIFVATPRPNELNRTRQKAKIFYIKDGKVVV